MEPINIQYINEDNMDMTEVQIQGFGSGNATTRFWPKAAKVCKPGTETLLANMALDSKAVFTARLEKLGLGAYKDEFTAKGWTTLAEFGFSTNYVPGRHDETQFLTDVVNRSWGTETM